MASVAFDSQSQNYYVRFRYRGRAFKRSLLTGNRKLAEAARARAEETLMLMANGRLEMPDDADPATFILSDGKRSAENPPTRVATLGELCAAFQAARIPGAKEPGTIRTEDLHIRHLLRLLRKTTFVQSIRTADLQVYVTRRLKEKCAGRPIAAETVRKELATLRVVWNWAIRNDLLDRPAPVVGLEYRRDVRHFMATIGISSLGELRAADHRAVIAWEAVMREKEQLEASTTR